MATEVTETAKTAEAAEVPGERENDPAATELPATELPATEPAGTEPGDQSPAADLVTVIRGVPRFHQEDCVLIRFMPEGDAQKMPGRRSAGRPAAPRAPPASPRDNSPRKAPSPRAVAAPLSRDCQPEAQLQVRVAVLVPSPGHAGPVRPGTGA